MKLDIKINKLDYILPRLLIVTIVFFLYKVTFWPITYLFVVSYIIFAILFLIRNDWKFGLSNFFIDFLPPIILAGIFLIIALINNLLLHPIQQKDLLLIIVLFSFFYFLYWINVFLKLEFPKTFAVNMVVYTTFVVCCLNILNSISALKIPLELLSKVHISEGNTIADDYNFYCLFVIFGLVILNYKWKENVLGNRYSKIATISLSLVFIINIILSGSRRGIIVFIILILSYFVIEIVKKKEISGFQKFIRNSLILITYMILLFCFGMLIIRKIPHDKISIIVFRYSNFVGINDFVFIDKTLWVQKNKIPLKIDSLVIAKSYKLSQKYWKSSGRGAKLTKIKTNFSDGMKINVRSKKSGDLKLFFDMPAIIYFANHTYNISFKAKFIHGDYNSLNIGWWSDDGNLGNLQTFTSENKIDTIGDGWYYFNSKYTFIDNHIGIVLFLSNLQTNSEFFISDIKITDLDFDPNLQKMQFESKNENEVMNWLNEINPPINSGSNLLINGDFKYGLKFWRYSADSLSFKMEYSDSINYLKITRGDGNGGYYSLFYAGRRIYFLKNCEYQLTFKMKPIYPKTIPFQVGYWINEGEGIQNNLRINIDTLNKGWLLIKANYTFKNQLSNLIFPINSQIDNSQFYITDISLVNLTQPQYQEIPRFQVEDTTKSGTLYSGRTSRWQYAVELWKTEYKWYNKLFGHGFDYYEWFGKKFLNDSVRGDYPHNPFISVLLYSGILGLIFYFWLLYKVLFLYIYYRKKYGVLFICFLITFFFSFFSGSNPFDPSIMGFFMILPFFIHHVHKNRDQI